jgi:hypothetical protein
MIDGLAGVSLFHYYMNDRERAEILSKMVSQLRKENEILKKAITFYAEEKWYTEYPGGVDDTDAIDYGRRAIKALKKIKRNNNV